MGDYCQNYEEYYDSFMKLLIATGMFPPDVGGPATYSQTIAEEFSKRGHNITIVTYGDNIISNFPSLDSSPVGRGGAISNFQKSFKFLASLKRERSGQVSNSKCFQKITERYSAPRLFLAGFETRITHRHYLCARRGKRGVSCRSGGTAVEKTIFS